MDGNGTQPSREQELRERLIGKKKKKQLESKLREQLLRNTLLGNQNKKNTAASKKNKVNTAADEEENDEDSTTNRTQGSTVMDGNGTQPSREQELRERLIEKKKKKQLESKLREQLLRNTLLGNQNKKNTAASEKNKVNENDEDSIPSLTEEMRQIAELNKLKNPEGDATSGSDGSGSSDDNFSVFGDTFSVGDQQDERMFDFFDNDVDGDGEGIDTRNGDGTNNADSDNLDHSLRSPEGDAMSRSNDHRSPPNGDIVFDNYSDYDPFTDPGAKRARRRVLLNTRREARQRRQDEERAARQANPRISPVIRRRSPRNWENHQRNNVRLKCPDGLIACSWIDPKGKKKRCVEHRPDKRRSKKCPYGSRQCGDKMCYEIGSGERVPTAFDRNLITVADRNNTKTRRREALKARRRRLEMDKRLRRLVRDRGINVRDNRVFMDENNLPFHYIPRADGKGGHYAHIDPNREDP